MKTLGLRHVALKVKDPQISKQFYVDILKMEVEWEPDPENVYLTSGGQDNLALHRTTGESLSDSQTLNHIGFFVQSKEEVAEWYQWIRSQNVPVARELKDHRDGARSFYFKDPDGIVIQLIYHQPIVNRT